MSSSTPRICPISASTPIPAAVAWATMPRVVSRFTLKGSCDQSIMTDVQPMSMHLRIISRSLPWSRWSTTGTGESPAISLIQPYIASWL